LVIVVREQLHCELDAVQLHLKQVTKEKTRHHLSSFIFHLFPSRRVEGNGEHCNIRLWHEDGRRIKTVCGLGLLNGNDFVCGQGTILDRIHVRGLHRCLLLALIVRIHFYFSLFILPSPVIGRGAGGEGGVKTKTSIPSMGRRLNPWCHPN